MATSCPKRVIQGAQTGLSAPYGIAFDTLHDEILVTHHSSTAGISVFARTAQGNVPPLRRIAGAQPGLLNTGDVELLAPRFGADNVEAVVKVLDACTLNNRFWVFAAGLTDVSVEMKVTDLATGKVRLYTNPQGTAFQPIFDTDAFATCGAPLSAELAEANVAGSDAGSLATFGGVADEPSEASASGSCSGLCLNGDRFAVEATWRTSDGTTGSAHGVEITADTGYRWFFAPQNVETVVKVLNACSLNGRYWVFAAGLTDVKVTLTVRDTVTGISKTYVNPQGTPFKPILDTSAFATCP